MSVRVRYGLKVQVSSTSSEDKDLGNLSFEVVTDSLGEGGTRKFTLAGGATDVAIDLGNVSSAKLILVRTAPKDPNETLPEVRLRLNSVVGEEISVSPIASSVKEAHGLLSSTGITALYATNSSASVEVELTVAVAGD
jgi:hypothetical protein